MNAETRTAILNHYQRGQGSIQDIARVYRVNVEEVLEIIGETGVSSVTMGGDLIDQSEAGREAVMNYGSEVSVPFTLN